VNRRIRQQLYAGAALWAIAFAVLAADTESTTIYRSVGPDGVVAFSDAPHPSSIAIEVVPPPTPMKEEIERANQLFEQQLALLEFLETSRHARAKDDLEQQRLDLDYVRTGAEVQQVRDQDYYDDGPRYLLPYYPGYGLGWGNNRPSRPALRPPFQHPLPRPPMGHPLPQPPQPPQHINFPH
jgi:Domain of unknown function (DUF4124)